MRCSLVLLVCLLSSVFAQFTLTADSISPDTTAALASNAVTFDNLDQNNDRCVTIWDVASDPASGPVVDALVVPADSTGTSTWLYEGTFSVVVGDCTLAGAKNGPGKNRLEAILYLFSVEATVCTSTVTSTTVTTVVTTEAGVESTTTQHVVSETPTTTTVITDTVTVTPTVYSPILFTESTVTVTVCDNVETVCVKGPKGPLNRVESPVDVEQSNGFSAVAAFGVGFLVMGLLLAGVVYVKSRFVRSGETQSLL
jgi:hypothetical protein